MYCSYFCNSCAGREERNRWRKQRDSESCCNQIAWRCHGAGLATLHDSSWGALFELWLHELCVSTINYVLIKQCSCSTTTAKSTADHCLLKQTAAEEMPHNLFVQGGKSTVHGRCGVWFCFSNRCVTLWAHWFIPNRLTESLSSSSCLVAYKK